MAIADWNRSEVAAAREDSPLSRIDVSLETLLILQNKMETKCCYTETTDFKLLADSESDDTKSRLFTTPANLDVTTPIILMRKVIVTGFGSFCGVSDNPTSRLVEWLAREQAHLIAGHDILVVAVEDVNEWFNEFESKKIGEHGGEDGPFLLLLGVDSSSDEFALESTSYNCIDFPCPDERHWQPNEPIPIDPSHPLDSTLTSAHVDEIHKHMSSQGYTCQVSVDPGRFLCNYIYYSALSRGHRALFCHVPPFSAISEDRQREFVTSLISTISNLVYKHT